MACSPRPSASSSSGGRLLVCKGGAVPDLTTSYCKDQGSTSDGAHNFCCLDGAGYADTARCVTDSANVPCGAGALGIECNNGQPPELAGQLSCSAGSTIGSQQQIYGYCCANDGATCTAGGAGQSGCQPGSQPYFCNGAARPDASGYTLACATLGTVNEGAGLSVKLGYCCVALTTSSDRRQLSLQVGDNYFCRCLQVEGRRDVRRPV